jgi:NADH dehydrogenase FAD-containing subunit
MTKIFETDYLIIGAGAAAMAFADELLTNSDARILMVDRRDEPVVTGTMPIRSSASINLRHFTA